MRVTIYASLLLLIACSERQPLRVGAKDFAEQRVLAEIAIQLLKDDGWAVEPAVPCGDTYACYGALQAGDLDLLIDYTGTGFVFKGVPASSGLAAIARLRELYEPMGLTWLTPLGFDNGYILVVRGDDSLGHSQTEISHLAAAGALRVACPAEFLRRPLDGLQSLLRRYGLRLQGEPLISEDPQVRVAAVLDGRADVAILYGTDGAALDSRLRTLTDDLGFFPEYGAAFVARSRVLKSHPGLEQTVARLGDRISRKTMRELNRSVQLEGATPAVAATTFLVEHELLSNPDILLPQTPTLMVASHQDDRLVAFAARALVAVRSAYPRRTVEVHPSNTPVGDTSAGRTRLTLLGAERFFATGGRDDRLEAVVALGSRTLHNLCRLDLAESAIARVGIESAGGGAIVAREVIEWLDWTATSSGTRSELLKAAQAGQLDCVMILAEQGDGELAAALGKGILSLRPIEQPHSLRPLAPYLRPTRIPAHTYHGQPEAIETYGSQVVLAGPGRTAKPMAATGGPATALPASGQPLPAGRVQAMAAAGSFHEAPDPVLPSAWERSLARPSAVRAGGGAMEAVLNGLVLLFIGWLVYLVFRKAEA
jgi:osmoprotectant transport system permease protein